MNPPAARPFSADELQALRDRYATEGAAILAQEMGRSYAAVKAKANRLGMKTIKPPLHVWTTEEDAYLREKWPLVTRRKLKAAQVTAHLKLPEHWVRSRAMALGLAISHRRMPPWSEEEDNYICENRHLHYDVLRNRLKNRGWYRSSGAILNRLYQLGQSTQRTGNSYSIHYLASLLGVTEKTIGRWVRLGWLPAKARSPGKNHHGAPVEYAITPQAVRKFLITHTHYVDISQADKHWLISLLAGEETSCLRQTQCGTSHEAANGYDEHTVQV